MAVAIVTPRCPAHEFKVAARNSIAVMVSAKTSAVFKLGMDILWPQMLAMLGLGVALLTTAVLRFRKAVD